MRKAKSKISPTPPPDSAGSLPSVSSSTESETTQEGEPTGLPDYNPDRKCVKCRSIHANTRYERNIQQVSATQVVVLERMERTCDRCGFVWYENVCG